MSACQCQEKINAKLAEYNTLVKPIYSISDSGLAPQWPVETSQVETGRGKAKAMALFASYCPFCGISLRAPKAAAESMTPTQEAEQAVLRG